MTRVRVLSLLVFAAALITPANISAQSQAQVDDLSRRVSEVERQLFQQRLAQPVSPQGQAVEQLRHRLDVLERQILTDRITDTAAAVSVRAKSPQPESLQARIAQLEKQQAEDAKLIKELTARIEKLEKPVFKIKPLKKDR